ncbi:hypothetical protein HK099_002078 [Clydaea vesicula]|uniref:Hexosyltransferase n=1 Tax=Clydaea vesicula TaxID=447962 RepID=A0AAD5XS53_9FUNG|nr:hypothetical protein HK099_002078 [Clydaea vesicula]KAJ3383647.1 hypothetical protein HDU92_004033 [Lobulomyces angularis]
MFISKKKSKCLTFIPFLFFLSIFVSLSNLDISLLNLTGLQLDDQQLEQELVVNRGDILIDSSSVSGAKNKDKIFIGLLTTAEKFYRRNLIRDTYLNLKPLNIEFKFILGKPKDEETETLLKYENLKHQDLLILDIEENMNNGKTFKYFSTIYELYKEDPFKFVMKTDDDVFLHLPNIEKKFKDMINDGVYYGRSYSTKKGFFMMGMGYVLSWDLVEYIATDPFPRTMVKGQEDSLVSYWLQRGKVIKNKFSDEKGVYWWDFEHRGEERNFIEETILVHSLKKDERFLVINKFFLEYEREKQENSTIRFEDYVKRVKGLITE